MYGMISLVQHSAAAAARAAHCARFVTRVLWRATPPVMEQ